MGVVFHPPPTPYQTGTHVPSREGCSCEQKRPGIPAFLISLRSFVCGTADKRSNKLLVMRTPTAALSLGLLAAFVGIILILIMLAFFRNRLALNPVGDGKEETRGEFFGKG